MLGRVARLLGIWARVLERNGTAPTSAVRKFKYHIQNLRLVRWHAREIHLNDIRTTLQALTATYDNNCNSLHTNALSIEAITTPTALKSVRRALAIQEIIDRGVRNDDKQRTRCRAPIFSRS